MMKTPIIKPRISSQGGGAAQQPQQPAEEEGGAATNQVESELVQEPIHAKQSTNQLKYIIAVGVAVIIVALLAWMAGAGQPVQQPADKEVGEASGETQAKDTQSVGDYSRVLERLKDASIRMSNAVERHRDAVATRKAAEALKGKPALVEATHEIERSANDTLTETKRAYAEVLAEAYSKRVDHPSEFDAAVTAYSSALVAKQLKTQGAEFARGAERVKAAPQGADMGYFEKVANGIF